MSVQAVIVALLVVACSLYAAWTLMPAAARRGIARTLLKLPLPGAVKRRLQRQLEASDCRRLRRLRCGIEDQTGRARMRSRSGSTAA